MVSRMAPDKYQFDRDIKDMPHGHDYWTIVYFYKDLGSETIKAKCCSN